MNHAVRAALALVIGLGLAATAQAHGNYSQRNAATPHMQAAMTRTMHHAATKATMTRQQRIKTAQQQLKADGFYRGPLNGVMNKPTKLALARFQQQNGMKRTAKLDRQTFDRLSGTQTVGVGSSTPKATLPPNGNANNNPTYPNSTNGQ